LRWPAGKLRKLIHTLEQLPPVNVDKFWADLEATVDYDPERGPGEPGRS
jgi:hypothetical protein